MLSLSWIQATSLFTPFWLALRWKLSATFFLFSSLDMETWNSLQWCRTRRAESPSHRSLSQPTLNFLFLLQKALRNAMPCSSLVDYYADIFSWRAALWWFSLVIEGIPSFFWKHQLSSRLQNYTANSTPPCILWLCLLLELVYAWAGARSVPRFLHAAWNIRKEKTVKARAVNSVMVLRWRSKGELFFIFKKSKRSKVEVGIALWFRSNHYLND